MGSALYFFLSDREFFELDAQQVTLWDKLEHGPISSEKLNAPEAISKLAKAQVLDVLEPIRSSDRKRILVIEPHSDDAALSIGATMWKMREEAEFHLLTMASRSNYTSAFQLDRNYFDRASVTKMRTSEGELFAQHLGGVYHCADLKEATLRYKDSDWTLDFFRQHQVPVAISNNRKAEPSVLEKWELRLREFLDGHSFDEIWIPLGAGTHSDHDLTRNASLRVLVNQGPRAAVRFYEDVPYGSHFQEHTQRVLNALLDAGAVLQPIVEDVTDVFSRKLSLLGIFASQFKVKAIEGGVQRSASYKARKVERFWKVQSLPQRLPEDQMWVGAPDVAEATVNLRKFREGADVAKRLAIFAINPSGRWASDFSALSMLFPRAHFVVYAGPQVCAEFREIKSDRVRTRCLTGRPVDWLKAALREFFTGHRIVIAETGHIKTDLLRKLWPLGRNLTTPAMDNLAQAFLRIQ